MFEFNGGYTLIAAIFLLSLPFVRLQDCRTRLQLQCQFANSVKNYLDNPFGPSNENLEVRCEVQPNNPLVGWSLSSDGIEDNVIPINTSLAKYTVSGNTLIINGLDASDEGIYRCEYTNAWIQRLCIKVYAKAVFASCPSSYDGCSEPENISVTAGEDIHFDASIVHTLGGNCGFKQTVDHNNMELRNCSNINCTSWSTINGNDRISLTVSPDIELERCFILSHSMMGDSGVYQVVVTGINPQNGGQSTSITKTYLVTVQGPTATTPTTEEKETTVTDGTSFSTGTTDGAYSSESCALAIAMPILIVIILFIIIITITIVCKLKRRKYKDSAEIPHLTGIGDCETGCALTSDDMYTTDAQSSNGQSETGEFYACHNGDVLPHSNMQDQACTLSQKASNTITEELQQNFRNNTNSSDGTSSPASEQQSTSSEESQRIESSSDDVGEPCSPSEDQRLKRESQRIESSPDDIGEPCSPSESQQLLKLRESHTVESSPVDVDEPCDHSESERPKLRALQENFQNNADSSDGTSSPAPKQQSNDDQDIIKALQQNFQNNTNSSDGTSSRSPAPEQQSNSDQDIISDSQRIENSDDVGEPRSPSEDQQFDTARRIENSPEDVGEQGGPSEIQPDKRSREGLKLDLSSRPTLSDLMNHVAAKTPTKWMVLGIQLGLEAAQLQALDHQHRGRSDSIFADIFDYWGKSSELKPVTWLTMIEALKCPSVDEIALAHHLESTVLSTCRDSNSNMHG